MLREQYERVRTELYVFSLSLTRSRSFRRLTLSHRMVMHRQRTSNELGEAEQANERHSRAIEDLTRKVRLNRSSPPTLSGSRN